MTEQQMPHQPAEMNSTSPLNNSMSMASRRAEGLQGSGVTVGLGSPGSNGPIYREQAALQQQIMQLKQQQHLQQQILLQQYQVQQRQLEEQHQKQLQEFLEQKKKRMEEEARQERERREKERLAALKNKEKREQSAVASSEVKQKLQEFVLQKKQREAAAAAAAANGISQPGTPSSSSAQYRAWTGAVPSVPKGSSSSASSGTSSSPTGSGQLVHPHPYRHPLLPPGNYNEDDFPLRKTASEGNLLKMRYKHRGTGAAASAAANKCSPRRQLIQHQSSHHHHQHQQHHFPPPSALPPPPLLPPILHPHLYHVLPPPPPPAHLSSSNLIAKRMTQLASQESQGGSTPESGHSGASSPLGPHHSLSGTLHEESSSSSPYGHLMAGQQQGSISDLTLYTSPSLPNISLGRPALPSHSQTEATMDVEMRTAFATRMGLPLGGGNQHIHHPMALPPGLHHFYPHLPAGIHQDPHHGSSSSGGEYSGSGSPESPAFIHKQMQLLEQSGHHHLLMAAGSVYTGGPITDAQVAQARLNKSGMRPLGRTQSAPLPLGHPLLQGVPTTAGGVPTMPLTQEQFDQYLRERQLYEQQQQQQQQHNLLKQHIRQTVLTRAGSRSQVENVEEETEAAIAREMSRSEAAAATSVIVPHPEVIDLTEHKLEEEAAAAAGYERSSRDGLPPIQLRKSAFVPRGHHIVRPLSRAFSSPLVSLEPPPDGVVLPKTLSAAGWVSASGGAKAGSTSTALAYDALMLRHQCMCGNNSAHPEHGGRLQSIWARLQETGLVHRCLRVRSRKATLEELQSVHSEAYTLLFGTDPINRQKVDTNRFAELPMKNFVMLPCGGIGVDSDTTWNDIHTASAARMAAGCVIDLAFKAATGEIKNGFAVVRPPGHHAEAQQAMGFCFFNSVAIAAKQLRLKHKMERILILDWDVHHGNGTQQIFYDDPHVLYISIHRHDDGHFFPGTGSPLECGAEDGVGFNVNIAWSGGLSPPLGDAEYLAAFRTLIMPIAQDFDPEIILISAGFDATMGHPSPLGGYQVSPACFGLMTRQLSELAGGKIVMALEGGYDLPSICDATHECVRALLGEETVAIRPEELARRPCQNAVDSLSKIFAIQQPHWPVIKRFAFSAGLSAYETEDISRRGDSSKTSSSAAPEGGEDSETLSAMAGLSVCRTDSSHSLATTSREPSQEPMEQDESK